MNIRKNIPNFITLLNLISGSVAIVMALSGEMACASWFIIIAAVFDFCDGLAARILHAKSPIGAQLDSLADVVSFGLAPSAIVYGMLKGVSDLPHIPAGHFELLPFLAFILACGSAWRLAKFNTDPEQAEEFKGLPTPAMGLFIAAFPLIIRFQPGTGIASVLQSSFYLLLAVVLFLSAMMVSNIPMMSLKFRNLHFKENIFRYILITAIPVLFVFFRFSAVPVLIFLYIILSFIGISLKKS